MAAAKKKKKVTAKKKVAKPASEKVVQEGFAGIRGAGVVRQYRKGSKHTVVFKPESGRPKRYSGGKAGADAAFAAFVVEAKS